VLEEVLGLAAAVRAWPDDGERLRDAVATCAAGLVVLAVTTQSRPSDSLASIAHGIGLSSAASWFGPEAPRFIAARPSAVYELSLAAALMAVVVMTIAPLVGDLPETSLLGAPVPAGLWILLLVCAQTGDLGPTLRSWQDWTVAARGPMVGILVGGALLWAVAIGCGLSELVRLIMRRPVLVAWRVLAGISFAGVAVTFAAIWLPSSLASRFFSVESESSRKVGIEMAEMRAAAGPTGASGNPAEPARVSTPGR
jgi:hypothetical protein